ncbi:MAG: PHP domain-containing protein, partial [Cyanobacteria bacterium J06648_11]
MSQLRRSEVSPSIAELKAVWAQLDRYSCPWHYNFHMHTIHSDGRLTPDALVRQVSDIGLQGFAITDHHS